MQDIVFNDNPKIQEVENLNKETFKTTDISNKYYYKKVGILSPELKKEIEKEIKNKFDETSDILDDFDWKENRNSRDYFLYAMLKKEFQFEKAFEDLDTGKFGKYEDVKYFGIMYNDSYEVRNQVEVLYYNSRDDFAIKLKTKQEDEVIICKSPKGNNFNQIYNNIKTNEAQYNGNKNFEEGELLKIPNINLKEKVEFNQIENQSFNFKNGESYHIGKAMQTIEFELDRAGGRIKSEAGMSTVNLSGPIEEEKELREFLVDDTFAIFLKEEGKEVPYFAGLIEDITKFQ